jgi:hypothetical protein
MGKNNKLDLINNRYHPPGFGPKQVFDSSEKLKIKSYINTNSVKFNDISKFAKEPKKFGAHNANYDSHVNEKGQIFECQHSIGKDRMQLFKSHVPPTVFGQSQKRIDTEIMNRVMDNIHFVPTGKINLLRLIFIFIIIIMYVLLYLETIWDHTVYQPWSELNRKPEIPATHLGVGDYEITNFEKSKWGSQPKGSCKFSEVPRQNPFVSDDSKPSLNKNSTFRNNHRALYSKPNSADSSIKSRRVRSNDTNSITSKNTTKGFKWDDISRWNSHIYRKESYVKTSGMVLGQDYEKAFDKRLGGEFGTSKRTFKDATTAGGNVDVDVDCPPKVSMAKMAILSPIKYSAAFISKAPVGMHIPIPTTGDLLGMDYPGTFTPACVVKEPHKPMPSFLCDPDRFPIKQAAPDVTNELKSFGDRNRNGPHINKTGGREGGVVKNQHQSNISKVKIKQIYPVMGKKKYRKTDPFTSEDLRKYVQSSFNKNNYLSEVAES